MEARADNELTARASAHASRIDAYVAPHLARRAAGMAHPVFDFLFTYYSYRPAQLRAWHPGLDASHALVAERAPLISSIHRLLVATASRPGNFGCFGLHEWAMVYRQSATRHPWPLRLGRPGTDEVVETHRIACSQVHTTKGTFFWRVNLANRACRVRQPRRLNGGTSVSRW